MKKVLVFLSLVLLPGMRTIAQESDVIGIWLTEKKTSHIRIFKATNGLYYGKVEWLKNNPDRTDLNNPDPAKQKDTLLGLLILKGFSYDSGEKQWINGTIYDPDNGKTYDCYMWFGDDIQTLYIKGFVLGMHFMGRETIWTRVKP